jgi:hypothetical protein
MSIWKLLDAGVLTEDQADRLEELSDAVATAVLQMVSGPAPLSHEQLQHAIDAAQGLLAYFTKWGRNGSSAERT